MYMNTTLNLRLIYRTLNEHSLTARFRYWITPVYLVQRSTTEKNSAGSNVHLLNLPWAFSATACTDGGRYGSYSLRPLASRWGSQASKDSQKNHFRRHPGRQESASVLLLWGRSKIVAYIDSMYEANMIHDRVMSIYYSKTRIHNRCFCRCTFHRWSFMSMFFNSSR